MNWFIFPHDVFVLRTTTLRSSSKLLYHQPFAHTHAFFHSFVPKTCSAWNNLPDYITHASTLSVFKSSLSSYMYRVNVVGSGSFRLYVKLSNSNSTSHIITLLITQYRRLIYTKLRQYKQAKTIAQRQKYKQVFR